MIDFNYLQGYFTNMHDAGLPFVFNRIKSFWLNGYKTRQIVKRPLSCLSTLLVILSKSQIQHVQNCDAQKYFQHKQDHLKNSPTITDSS